MTWERMRFARNDKCLRLYRQDGIRRQEKSPQRARQGQQVDLPTSHLETPSPFVFISACGQVRLFQPPL